MKHSYRSIVIPVVVFAALITLTGCKKKAKPLPPAATAPVATAPAPTAVLTATPNVVSAGDQVQLSWRTTDATKVQIDGIGDVPSSGVKTVTPNESISYHLVATGDGGNTDATARVTVNPPPAVAVPTSTLSAEEEFRSNVQDLFFDYDTYDLRDDQKDRVTHDAAYLSSHPDVKIVIGGYCDDRGSNEYNLALGQKRADSVKEQLVAAGVAASRIRVVSYGKEKPFCTEATEECWQSNRRGGITIDR